MGDSPLAGITEHYGVEGGKIVFHAVEEHFNEDTTDMIERKNTFILELICRLPDEDQDTSICAVFENDPKQLQMIDSLIARLELLKRRMM